MASSERRSRSLCGAQPPAPQCAPLAIAQHPVRKHPVRAKRSGVWETKNPDPAKRYLQSCLGEGDIYGNLCTAVFNRELIHANFR